MRHSCYCGQGFDVTVKQARQLPYNQQLFCSIGCLLKYINDSEPSVNLLTEPSFVSEDNDCFDSVTQNWYRSFYEVYFARFLRSQKIDFLYEPHSLHLNDKVYTPDFLLTEKGIYVECKGRWGDVARWKSDEAAKQVHLIIVPSNLYSEFRKKYAQFDDIVG